MGKRGLFALGLAGGMIPSVSALLVLIGSISIGRPTRFPQSAALDLGRRVPVLSAVVVLLAGALVAGQGLLGLGL
jgi:hypothetical protein